MKDPKIEIGFVCRPCLVNNEKALFHTWAVDERLYLKFDTVLKAEHADRVYQNFKNNNVCGPEAHIEKITSLLGLVEYSDGTVDRVIPDHIQFLDSKEKFDSICFE